MSRSLAALTVAASLAAAAAPAAEVGTTPAEWPGFLGPNGNLSVVTGDGPGTDAEIAFRTRWKKPLGSGYSGIAVAGGLLYTLASDGTDDVLVCLDAASGDERWRYVIAPTWRGLQGSLDGPMSTPAVASGVVAALGPRGHLVALDRLTGELRWRVDLAEAYKARSPVYGFATSPLIDPGSAADGAGARAIVQVGGRPDAGIVAFELETGKVAWKIASEPIEYQSAAALELSGQRQLIGIADTMLYGIEPVSGRVLWSQTYLPRAQDAGAHALPAGPDRFLVNTRTGALLYEASGATIRQLWSSRELAQSYAIPLVHDGYVYGYSGEFLTCIDAATGKRVWKSRPPGKGALLLLNDLLVAWGIDGRLSAARATPGGYAERAGLQVLELGSITPPAYADKTLYVRNHEEIAAVELRRQRGAAARDTPAETTPAAAQATPFTRFVEQLSQAPDKKARVDAFMKEHSAFPIVEGPDLIHFVYRGRARDLALYLGSVSRQGADPLRLVPGSDFWYRSYRLEPGGRYDYQFQLNYDRLIADPLNPRRAPSPGDFSELALPGWTEPEALRGQPAEGSRRGTLEELKFHSKVGNNTRKLQVYLPPGYAETQQRYPLLIVSGGDEALKYGAMDRILDDAIGRGSVEALVVAWVSYAGGRTWRETGGPEGERYAWMLGGELTQYLQRNFRLRPGRENRAVMGAGLSGYASLLAAMRAPGVFGKVATQSLYTHNQPVADALAALIADPGDAPLVVYMDWCSLELSDPGEGMDLRRDNLRLSRLLAEAGHRVDASEIAAGPGWGTWRSRTERILRTLFPAAETP